MSGVGRPMVPGRVLGIESTAHTASVGVVSADEDGVMVIGSNVSSSYSPKEGGIHPREAANHHAEVLPGLIRGALDQAGVSPGELVAVAFAQGPGLGPCLRTGASAARALALTMDIPLVGVNHCVAHLEVGRAVMGCQDPVLLYASGGNTQVIAHAAGRYRVFGETLDIGIGNMLDKLGREMGLPFPAGPALEEMALQGDRLLPLPYSVKGMDVAFSGMLTAAIQLLAKEADPNDMAMSVQETAFAMLVEVTERATGRGAFGGRSGCQHPASGDDPDHGGGAGWHILRTATFPLRGQRGHDRGAGPHDGGRGGDDTP
jgi:glycoprotease/Kae1 family metallohydrolase